MDVTDIQNFVINFTAIVWEALPFIVIGALIAGILEELLPQEAIAKILPKHFLPAVLLGGVLGLIFPMCECGIVVVMRRLLKKGLPLSCCVSYMLAGPILNIVVIMSTWYAFSPHMVGVEQTSLGWPMILIRCGMGFLVAVTTGMIVHFVQARSQDSLTTVKVPAAPAKELSMISETGEDPAKLPKKPLMARINNITETALHDFMDIMVFLIIGSALAAIIKTNPAWITQVEQLSRDNPFLAIPIMMFLAVLLCLCSEADAFLAASFVGMSISAKSAFLVLGPMFDFKLLLMYTRVFKLKLILTIVVCTSLQVLIYSTLLHFVYNPTVIGAPTAVESAQ